MYLSILYRDTERRLAQHRPNDKSLANLPAGFVNKWLRLRKKHSYFAVIYQTSYRTSYVSKMIKVSFSEVQSTNLRSISKLRLKILVQLCFIIRLINSYKQIVVCKKYEIYFRQNLELWIPSSYRKKITFWH